MGSPHRSRAWRSVAETDAPLIAESSTRLRQAAPEADETEAAIQASLAAALDDLDRLERATPVSPVRNERARVQPKIPRGMPPLPHGRLIPPLPVSRNSLLPRLLDSLRPKPVLAKAPALPPATETVLQPQNEAAVRARPRGWPIIASLLLLGVVVAALWWVQLR